MIHEGVKNQWDRLHKHIKTFIRDQIFTLNYLTITLGNIKPIYNLPNRIIKMRIRILSFSSYCHALLHLSGYLNGVWKYILTHYINSEFLFSVVTFSYNHFYNYRKKKFPCTFKFPSIPYAIPPRTKKLPCHCLKFSQLLKQYFKLPQHF